MYIYIHYKFSVSCVHHRNDTSPSFFFFIIINDIYLSSHLTQVINLKVIQQIILMGKITKTDLIKSLNRNNLEVYNATEIFTESWVISNWISNDKDHRFVFMSRFFKTYRNHKHSHLNIYPLVKINHLMNSSYDYYLKLETHYTSTHKY